MSHTDRIIALIDMDCFYCQVEEQLDPNLVGKPIAVVQYNQWKGGGIIAVNYIAREKGVTRQMRGDEAREKCPEIQLPRVPQVRGKADLTKYREAGKKVAEVLLSFTNILERASIDEAYLDLTEAVNQEMKQGMPVISLEDLNNTFVVGRETADFISNVYQNQRIGLSDDEFKLMIGGVLVERIRAEVLKKTGFKCSAGIAHNKTLAKLVCSLHKPNKQTILPQNSVSEMFSNLPIRKIKSLGGKFGSTLSEQLKINYIGELVKFSEKELIQKFDEKNGRWLYNICRGIDNEPVQIKLIPKSIGCCKRFPGKGALIQVDDIKHWINELSLEISERLEEDLRENNRKGRLMTVGFSQEINQNEVSSTRAVQLKSYQVEKICQSALDVLQKNCQKPDGSYHVTFLGLTIGNFENMKNIRSIDTYFKKGTKENEEKRNSTPLNVSNTRNVGDKINNKNNIINYFKSVESSSKNDFSEASTLENDKNSTTNEIGSALGEHNCEFEYNNSSVLSDSTISLDENPDDLVFYKDTRESATEDKTNQVSTIHETSSFQRSDSMISVGSLEDEINLNEPESGSPILKSSTSKSGFFQRYFEPRIETPPCERDFDTSKNLFTDSSSEESIENDETSEICKECGQNIPNDEIVSHMDYHLALKLSERSTPIKRTQKDSTVVNNSKKRKTSEMAKRNILTFFKTDKSVTDEATETCSECNKKISLRDIESHSDYHLAKKLHQEINNVANNSAKFESNKIGGKKTKAGSQNDKNTSKCRSITAFFSNKL